MIVAKNNLLRKSVELSDHKDGKLGEFVKDLTGSNILLFSELNPYALIILLDKSKVRVPAKAGDIATGEIMIPAGNTGLPPGPVISEFGEIRVKTKIEGGSIWVATDPVAKCPRMLTCWKCLSVSGTVPSNLTRKAVVV